VADDPSVDHIDAWRMLVRKAAATSDVEFNRRFQAQQPGACCTIVATSGTTSTPKAGEPHMSRQHASTSWPVPLAIGWRPFCSSM
jgi:hypothetical protein